MVQGVTGVHFLVARTREKWVLGPSWDMKKEVRSTVNGAVEVWNVGGWTMDRSFPPKKNTGFPRKLGRMVNRRSLEAGAQQKR